MIVTARTLNVRSGPGTDFRVLSQVFQGDQVLPLETHGDWAWVEPPNGWVHRGYLDEEPTKLLVPSGLAAIISTFGNPGTSECSAGRVILPYPLKIGWSKGSVTRVSCHLKMEKIFTEVFREIASKGLWGSLSTFDGIYNDRPMKTGSKKSTHAWGIAVDLNEATNAQGTPGTMDKRIVAIFEGYGFVWGGRWVGSRCDPMHFQYASGY